MMNLEKLQEEIRVWGEKNFPGSCWQMCVMGVNEEAGELNHALLKQWQGIRGDYDQHEADAKDAVGDIVIFLLHLCVKRGWRFEEIIDSTWSEVNRRDWQAAPGDGVSE